MNLTTNRNSTIRPNTLRWYIENYHEGNPGIFDDLLKIANELELDTKCYETKFSIQALRGILLASGFVRHKFDTEGYFQDDILTNFPPTDSRDEFTVVRISERSSSSVIRQDGESIEKPYVTVIEVIGTPLRNDQIYLGEVSLVIPLPKSNEVSDRI